MANVLAGSAEPERERTVVIQRTFPVPARLVFLAYSTPEHIKNWFGPPGYPVTMAEMDFRKGGKFRFQMTGPDGPNTPFGGEYLEIVPNKLIQFTNGFEEPGAGRMVMTVALDERDGKTHLTLTTVFESIAMMNEHVSMGFKDGTNAGYDQLADLVQELARA